MELHESENARYALGMSEDNNETARVEVAFGEVGKFLRSLHVSMVPSKAASPRIKHHRIYMLCYMSKELSG